MGSASREALAAAREVLNAQGAKANLPVAEELFEASRALGRSAQLRSALADPSVEGSAKAALAKRIFASLSAPAVTILEAVASERWSNSDELLAGIEELGIRAVAATTPKTASGAQSIEQELFAFSGAVSSNAQLELALRGKLAAPEAKAALVERLIGGKASTATIAIVRQLTAQPRGRSVREAVRWAAGVVADQGDTAVATVSSAAPLSVAQLTRLESGLAKKYGRALSINQVVDPELLGGIRVQIADDVIDGSIAARLNEVRLQLAS